MKRFLLAGILGAILGFAASRFLWLGLWTLLPWGLAGIALGYGTRSRWPVLAGAVYGFVLSFVFMAAGYTGKASFLSRVPFFALLGSFGALCGLLLGLAGAVFGRRRP
jgi:hypothetical protein